MVENPDDTAGREVTAIAQWVAGILRDRIVKGVLPPGSRIVERRISAEFDVSRTPVREALKLIEADGLIVISRNRGAQVLQYEAGEARQLFDVIAAIESLAAERLAGTISNEVLDVLEELHDRMLTYHKVGNHTDYFDTNSEIHDHIIESAGNPILTETHTRLIGRARRGRFLAIMQPARLTEAVAEHEEMMAALRGRDPERAAKVWRQHLFHTGETVASLLEENAALAG